MSREKIDMSVIDNCQNLAESYGEICVKCNKCGRFDKEKQIEEMAEMMCRHRPNLSFFHSDAMKLSKALYNAGYRKPSRGDGEGEWVKVYQNDIGTVYECSRCCHLSIGTSDYCICGAKMKDGAE